MKKFKILLAKKCLNIVFGVESVPRQKPTYRVWLTTNKGRIWQDFNEYLTAKRWIKTHINPDAYPDEKYTLEEVKVLYTDEEI